MRKNAHVLRKPAASGHQGQSLSRHASAVRRPRGLPPEGLRGHPAGKRLHPADPDPRAGRPHLRGLRQGQRLPFSLSTARHQAGADRRVRPVDFRRTGVQLAVPPSALHVHARQLYHRDPARRHGHRLAVRVRSHRPHPRHGGRGAAPRRGVFRDPHSGDQPHAAAPQLPDVAERRRLRQRQLPVHLPAGCELCGEPPSRLPHAGDLPRGEGRVCQRVL